MMRYEVEGAGDEQISGIFSDLDELDPGIEIPDITSMIRSIAEGEGTNSVLSDSAILEAMEAGHIKIFPFDPNQLNNCSYDVRLGKFYYQQIGSKGAITPDSIHEMWDGPYEMKVNMVRELDIPFECRYLTLKPGETILINTFDFIGGCHDIVSTMKSKSTTARMCVSVCGDAGWGDIGYTNRWCMQIRNNGIQDVILVWGMKIAQIIFHKSSVPSKHYSKDGNYQSTDDFNKIMMDWDPCDMLPKKKLELPPEFTIGDPEGQEPEAVPSSDLKELTVGGSKED